MINSKLLRVVFLFSFLLFQIFSFNSPLTGITTTNSSMNNNKATAIVLPDPHSLETNIIMLNYVNDTNFTNGILNRLPTSISVVDNFQTIHYQMNYHFIFPDTVFMNNFKGNISSLSTPNSPTVDINQTALKYQAVYNTVQNIFIDKTGTAINGTALENWLWTNGQQFKTANISYQIFLLNLTYIPSKLYWFNIPEPDEVTHQQRHEWRLEWDYPPFRNINNFNAKFPYPGYSSNYPMYYLDPSAFNWYLNWTRIWRNVGVNQNNPYYLNSFSAYLQKIGGFFANESLAGAYIGNWLSEIVHNLFVFNPLNGAVTSPSSFKLQVAVLTDENNTNPYPDLTWAINNTIVKNQLTRVLPSSTITVQTNFYNISQYPDVQNLLNTYKIPGPSPPPIPDYTYYDGYGLFNQMHYYDYEFFNSSATVTAYIFILNNASFAGANWNGGGLFTGLGGGGRLLILNEVDRLFYNRTTDPIPKESLSKVLIHEAGHAIGLPHPFSEVNNQYASDFIGEVMGYYSSTANYSDLFVSNFQRLSLEPTINTVTINLQQLIKTNLSQDYLQNLINTYDLFVDSYKSLNFQLAKTYLNQVQSLMDQIVIIEPGGPKPPIFTSSPSNDIMNLGASKTLTWQVYDVNPWRYIVYVNNSVVKTDYWNNSYTISFTFNPEKSGSFNITLEIFNLFNLSTSKSVLIYVKNSTPSAVIQSTNTNKNSTLDPVFAIIFPIIILPFSLCRKRSKQRK